MNVEHLNKKDNKISQYDHEYLKAYKVNEYILYLRDNPKKQTYMNINSINDIFHLRYDSYYFSKAFIECIFDTLCFRFNNFPAKYNNKRRMIIQIIFQTLIDIFPINTVDVEWIASKFRMYNIKCGSDFRKALWTAGSMYRNHYGSTISKLNDLTKLKNIEATLKALNLRLPKFIYINDSKPYLMYKNMKIYFDGYQYTEEYIDSFGFVIRTKYHYEKRRSNSRMDNHLYR